ncbi:MAG: aldehyde dehydrogenase family protein, partial [OM182 bacterium]
PSLLNNPDYSSVINERHFDRLTGYVDEARAAGAEVVEINPQNEDFRQQPHRKMPPTLIINPPEETAVMQEEIFGPLMVIKGYRETEETIDYVNDHDRPLGLYYFGHDRAEQERVLRRTTSGGVTLNDVVMHITQDNLPFGGVGPSGMGHYHGEDGFRTFSHAKAVYRQAGFNILERIGMRPPYGKKLEKLVRGQMK